jgi:hypothetical protein
MRTKFLTFFLLFSVYVQGQSYELINEVIKPSNSIEEKIYLRETFLDLEQSPFDFENFNQKTLEFWWNINPRSPSIDVFLREFKFDYLYLEIKDLIQVSNMRIKPKLLNNTFIIVDDVFEKKNKKYNYLTLSKPIFNCNKDWAILIKSFYKPFTQTGSGGVMCVYKKNNETWELYHSFNIWLM